MMNEQNDIRPVSEAALWYERVSNGKLTDSQMEEFEIWLDDPSNQREYAACARLWSVAGVPEFWAEAVEGDHEELREGPWQERKNVSRFGAGALAAWAASVLVTLGLFYQFWPRNSFEAYETAIGEQRLVTLADDSSIMLNTNSSIEVRYSDQSRQIDLIRGEAFFAVEKAPQPFEVKTSSGVLRALGTEFSVRYLSGQQVRLTVREGKVAVLSSLNMEQGVVPTAQAGEMLNLDSRGLTIEKTLVNPEQYMSWRQGVVSFSATPLQDVIEEVSRYTDRRIILEAKRLSSLQVSGVFHIGQVDSFLKGLTAAFPIAVEEMGQDLVLVEAT